VGRAKRARRLVEVASRSRDRPGRVDQQIPSARRRQLTVSKTPAIRDSAPLEFG